MTENRFKKSVDTATSNTLDNISSNISDNIKDNILTNIPHNIIYNILDNISSKEKKSRGGNHTFYLSAEVGEALNALSGKTGQSKSNLVNEILKTVLL